jgi:hypothetical protein
VILYVNESKEAKHGNGCFVYFESILTNDKEKDCFVLNPGKFVDIGVYGPLTKTHMPLCL